MPAPDGEEFDRYYWSDDQPVVTIADRVRSAGLRAIATPRGLSVDPGDGTSSFTCSMSVTTSDTCRYQYRRSGDYVATVAIVDGLTFEADGEQIDTSQVPAGLRTVTVDDAVDVMVREVQSRVTDLG